MKCDSYKQFVCLDKTWIFARDRNKKNVIVLDSKSVKYKEEKKV